MTAWQRLHEAFHVRKARSYRVVSLVVTGFIVGSIGLLLIESTIDPKPRLTAWIERIDRVILGIFVLELTIRVATFRSPTSTTFRLRGYRALREHVTSRIAYCFRPLTLVDIIAILALVPSLRGLRALRLLRLLRSAKLFRYANPFARMWRAVEDNALIYGFALSLFGINVLVGATGMYYAEANANPHIQNFGDAVWWSVVTISTVGFGDITPVTLAGRIVAGVSMVVGMLTLALFAGVVANTLLRAMMTIREEQFRVTSHTNHIVICGYEPDADQFLVSLLHALGDSEREVVIFAPGERPENTPPRYIWVRGNPTKESELDKVHIARAGAVALIAPRSTSPELADAVTLLTAFTIRSYLDKHALTSERAEPLNVVAEILDEENVAHAYAAGADEVIESRKLGFSMLAHTLVVPGTGRVLSAVATAGAHSMYVGAFPDTIEAPASFAEIAEALKQQHDAMLIGVRDPNADTEHLNPPDSLVVKDDNLLIYLAQANVLPEP